MVLFLPGDVRSNRIQIRRTDRERRIPHLPTKVELSLIDPGRALLFNLGHHIRHRFCSRQPEQHMHMVRDATDREALAIGLVDDPPSTRNSSGCQSSANVGSRCFIEKMTCRYAAPNDCGIGRRGLWVNDAGGVVGCGPSNLGCRACGPQPQAGITTALRSKTNRPGCRQTRPFTRRFYSS
jgi:hypothetical protein